MSYVKILNAATATNSPPVALATGTITTVAVADLVDGEIFTIWDDQTSYIFEIDKAGDGVTSGRTQVNVSSDTTADEVRDRIVTAINSTAIRITAASGGAATVSLTADYPGAFFNRTMTETVANGTFAVSGMSGATAGFPLALQAPGQVAGSGFPDGTDRAGILVRSTAGSGTMTVTLKLWGLSVVTQEWHPLGTSTTDADRGKLNKGTAIGEVASDKLQFAETVDGLSVFERVYLEVTAIGGTSTAVSAWLVV